MKNGIQLHKFCTHVKVPFKSKKQAEEICKILEYIGEIIGNHGL